MNTTAAKTQETPKRDTYQSSSETRAYAIHLYKQGLSLKEVGAAVGFSREAVRKWIPANLKRKKIIKPLGARILTIETAREIAELLRQGMPFVKIAEKVGVRTANLYTWAVKGGDPRAEEKLRIIHDAYPFTPRGADEKTRQRAIAMRKSGMTYWNIAKEIGYCEYTIRRWMPKGITFSEDAPPHKMRQRRSVPRERARAVKMVKNGATLRQASLETGFTKGTVLKWVQEADELKRTDAP